MNNSAISETLEQLARLLEYREGPSYLVNDFLQASQQLKTLEVPLEVFENSISNDIDRNEFDQMLLFWFGRYSRDLLWNLSELVLSGRSSLFEKLSRDISASAIEMLQIKALSIPALHFLRRQLNICDVETLKKACQNEDLSRRGSFSAQEELDILESIVNLEETKNQNLNISELNVDAEIRSILDNHEPDPIDIGTLFNANAVALANFIVELLLTVPQGSSIRKVVNSLTSNDTIDSVRSQASSVVKRIKRFFKPYESHSFDANSLNGKKILQDSLSENSSEAFSDSNTIPLIVEPTGAVQRGKDVVDRLDFLVETDDPRLAFARIKKSSFVQSVLWEKDRCLCVQLRPDVFSLPFNNRPTPSIPLYFFAASKFVHGTFQVLLSSSQRHWEMLKSLAKSQGMTLTAFGLYEGVRRVSSRTSERLYEKLSTPIVPVELREGIVERDWIDSGTPQLIELENIRGDLHLHSAYTDGTASIEELVSVARSLNLSYIAVTDHTQNVASVGGMNDVEFLRYWDKIDALNEKFQRSGVPFHILKGAEVDILEDGGLDLRDETLAKADWIVASIHFGKKQSRDQIHKRYMDAFVNPYVDVIAHPTGRVIGSEAPVDVDLDFLCENARNYGKCLELNSQPRRLDLPVEGLVLAQKYGVPVVISTDAHTADQMNYLQFGVRQARRAGFTPQNVLNALPFEEFQLRRQALRANLGAK